VKIPLRPAQIRELIPHRYPFLLVDRIEELEPGVRAVGVKNITQNEPFFQGHFPDYPIMPGVLIIEAMAQVGAVSVMAGGEHGDKLALFAGIDGVRFRRQVLPGDVLTMEVEIIRLKGRVGRGKGKATVGGERVCEAELMFAFAKKGEVP
jgi:3-hydroxyacyl-[acyl-carrier-protein] dehydratase